MHLKLIEHEGKKWEVIEEFDEHLIRIRLLFTLKEKIIVRRNT